MILTDHKKWQKLVKARRQPNLSFLPFSIEDLLSKIRTSLFPEISLPIETYFVDEGSLACICPQVERADIYVHQLLNHHETPPEVFTLICKHELLHLRIPPREIDGKMKFHPPEFWEAEKAIAPERGLVWAWVWMNLDSCLRRRRKLERIDVLSRWKEVWSRPRCDLESVRETLDHFQLSDDGW